jgi:UDP-glucose 4-epimerase|tara:strand:+ start:463 stop:1455 length:993 start_codon:yes stop_codon:yes gene_type:complete
MKVLVTGGAGFIGSHLCRRLVEEGNVVNVLDNFSTGKMNNVSNIEGIGKIYDGDVANYEDVLQNTKDVDYVLHLAYPYGVDGRGLHQAYIDTGVKGTYNILRASVVNNVKKVINISSVSAYGFLETNDSLKELQSGNQFLHYGVTKLSSELYCNIFPEMYGLETLSIRLFYGYGERYATLDHSALVRFLNNCKEGKDLIIYGDGKQKRDYTYVSDIVDGIVGSLSVKGVGQVYNISGGGTCSIIELAEKIKEMTRSDVNVKFADKGDFRYCDEFVKIPLGCTNKDTDGNWVDNRNLVADYEKAKIDFGYNPKVNLEDGILKTWEWLKNEG